MTTTLTPTTTNHRAGPAELADRATLDHRLAGYAGMHDGIMRDLRRLPAAIEALPDRAAASDLRHWFDLFEMVIVHHHEREDDVVFPLLTQVVPGFDARDLTADHRDLDGLMDELRPSLDDLCRPTGAGRGGELRDGARLHAIDVARSLGDTMLDHLRVEEQLVFPAVTDSVTAEQWAGVERDMRKGTSFKAITFTLPWGLDSLAEPRRREIMADLPAPFRILNALVWERSYRKVAAPVLVVS